MTLCAAALAGTGGAGSGAGKVWFRDEGSAVLVALMCGSVAGARTGAPGRATVGASVVVLDADAGTGIGLLALAALCRGPGVVTDAQSAICPGS